MMERSAAIAEIQRVFAIYKSKLPSDTKLLKALKDGKLYELYVLSQLIEDLVARGFKLVFKGTTLKFKASPGQIKTTDSHFEMIVPGARSVDFWIFVDIEFETLGRNKVGASDNSRRHEVDILVVSKDSGYPEFGDIALGVECKAVANFGKGLVKEVLGVRHELSLLSDSQPSTLTAAGGSPGIDVPAKPPSEFWLAFIDPKGLNYRESPAAFGINFRHLEP